MAEGVNLDKPFDGLERHPGDLITARDWNQIQIATKKFLWNNVGVIKEKSTLSLGNQDTSGSLYLFLKGVASSESHEKAAVRLDGEHAAMHLGGKGCADGGDIYLYSVNSDSADLKNASIRLNGNSGNISLGGVESGQDGDLLIYSNNSQDDQAVTIQPAIRLDGEHAAMHLGGKGCADGGDIYLYSVNSDSADLKNASIRLNGNSGNISLGGVESGQDGDLLIYSNNSPDDQAVTIQPAIRLDGEHAAMHLGGKGCADGGDIYLYSVNSDSADLKNASIRLNGNSAEMHLGGSCCSNGGNILLYSSEADSTIPANASIHLNGDLGNLWLGGNGQEGDIFLMATSGNNAIRLDAGSASVTIGGNKTGNGSLYIYSIDATSFKDNKPIPDKATIQLDGSNGTIRLQPPPENSSSKQPTSSSAQQACRRKLINIENQLLVHHQLQQADFIVGVISNLAPSETEHQATKLVEAVRNIFSQGTTVAPPPGVKELFTPPNSNFSAFSNGSMILGGKDNYGALALYSSNPVSIADHQIYMNGENGRIDCLSCNTNGSDCAEEFDIEESDNVLPGSIMVIAEAGRLALSKNAYDKCVAGVVSGAGDYSPGLLLGNEPSNENRLPISLMGKVYCFAEAISEPISVGDLLTSSSVPGHAMKASDPSRAFGAVLGKALEPLAQGETGLIAILVTLQ